MSEAERQAVIDEEHLRLLSIGYYVEAGVSAFYSLIGVMYAVMGVFFAILAAHAPARPGQEPPPLLIGGIFAAIGLTIFAFMVTMAVLKFIVARRLRQHRSRVFCMVVAVLCCLAVPYGTLLGVLTLIVLLRPTVVRQFEALPTVNAVAAV